MSALRIEAEAMVLSGFRVESSSFASAGSFISLRGGSATESGTASFTFSGMAGYYNVAVGYFDEGDGVSRLGVSHAGTLLDEWNLDLALGDDFASTKTSTRRTVATGLSIQPGETFQLFGNEDRGEPLRVDYIEFVPVVNPTPPSPPPAEELIRVEAEAMALTSFRVESSSFASAGSFISLRGGSATESGTASFTFSGMAGYYNVAVGYFDEGDGVSRLGVSHAGTLLDEWELNQELGANFADAKTSTRRTVATGLSIQSGETFQLFGNEDRGEPLRIDYVEFVPVTQGTDNRSENTADYSQAEKGVIANLETEIVLKPIYGALDDPKIMPLGDSITAGQHQDSPTPGAYRNQLWTNFSADGLSLNFVGTQANGSNSLGDKDHEGHPGWTIGEIDNLVEKGLLSNYEPDVVTLMIGTNDALGRGGNTLSGMMSDLSKLIDDISQELPDSHILVSSIAPIDPSGSKFNSLSNGQKKANRAEDYNDLIPDLIDERAAQGKNVTFVEAGGSLTIDDLVSDGIHPSSKGYNKLGNAWYDALVDRDTLIKIENLTGSAFDDILTGNSNANVFDGGIGSDTLTGGAGGDLFVYQGSDEGYDVITDFSFDDRLSISASGFGGGLTQDVSLSTSASATGSFVSGKTPISIGSSANFLYNVDTGFLSFDGDGTGTSAAVPIALLDNAPSLGAEQLAIVA